jgi:parallel beta helix pectate lyase-like protein
LKIYPFFILSVIIFHSSLYGADINLIPLVQNNNTITLDPSNSYYIENEFNIQHSVSIIGNGSVIRINGGPLRSTNKSNSLNIENCEITGNSAWAAIGYLNGATGILKDVMINCPGGTGIYINNSPLILENIEIANSSFGIQAKGSGIIKMTGGNITGCGICYKTEDGIVSEINNVDFSAPGGSAFYINNSSVDLCDVDISNSKYGLQGKGFSLIRLNGCRFKSCTYSYLQDDGETSWTQSLVDQPGGSAVTFKYNTKVNISDTKFIMSEKGSIAIQFKAESSGFLKNIEITGVSHGILADSGIIKCVSGKFSSDFKYSEGAGAGIASLKGASLEILDCEFYGLGNAIKISEYTPEGRAEVRNCKFINTEISAISAKKASLIKFINNLCEDPKQDAIFLRDCLAIIDRNRIYRSLNTGMAIINCRENFIISNNLIDNCSHQGIVLTENTRGSIIENNTIKESILSNILINEGSGGLLFNNIICMAPSANIRFHGAGKVDTFSNLIYGSILGIDEESEGNINLMMNRISENTECGILNYDSCKAISICCDFQSNASGGAPGNFSIFNNREATISGYGNRFGPEGVHGVYNNAGNSIDWNNNYWDDPMGPGGMGPGSGATVGWNIDNNSTLSFDPYSSVSCVVSDYAKNLEIFPGEKNSWKSVKTGVSIEIDFNKDSIYSEREICGALKCLNTDHIKKEIKIPANFLKGHVYVIWISHDIARYSDSIKIIFEYRKDFNMSLKVCKKKADGTYETVESTRNYADHSISIAPSDTFDAQGTYVLVQDGIKADGMMFY